MDVDSVMESYDVRKEMSIETRGGGGGEKLECERPAAREK